MCRGVLRRPWARALCLVPLLLTLVSVQSAQAAPPTQHASARAPLNANHLLSATNANGLNREVFGYAYASNLGDPTVGYPSWNFDLLSTVAFFSIRVHYDGV